MNAPLPRPPGERIAVVGSGIAGLACAWLLARAGRHVTLYEAQARLGGHSHTVDVDVDGVTHPVDTGFLVFNDRTYPNLVALFRHLGVASVGSEMSFSVSLDDPDLEWAGSNLATVFGQRRNLLRPGFWRMLTDTLRFNRETTEWLGSGGEGAEPSLDLRAFLIRGGYSDEFKHWYLLPMAGAIWSCPPAQMLDYPLATFIRFCHNHGLLQIFDRPQWRTVEGGARRYVERLAAAIGDVRCATPVEGVLRTRDHVVLRSADGIAIYDQVVFATHADTTLKILGDAVTPAERRVLAAIPFQRNRALLHTDATLLPRSRRLWSAWNYLGGRVQGGMPDRSPVAVSYLINRLQPLPFTTPVVVTLNPPREPQAGRLIAEFEYEHPLFDRYGDAAQRTLPEIQGENRSWFAGAWTGYGFHEDGLKSAIAVAGRLGASPPWRAAGEAGVTPLGRCGVPAGEYA
jgi:predicted NAD/FAD-binding protein